ncbi:GntR family transcriptional regulator [Paenibacillus pasadenensis]|uniref:Transcriptional regulator, GntR family n=1 Tax=Paenibacillus pasadenensis TaxID=217090 RepID=A0A2N5NAQ9_9BACL|nr:MULTISPECIES: GntR family transcriptional regulator [Paenibacillus]PLT47408.1 Transcriptional regulator, GntR family [Paenibacillus pasadenensis]QGG57682.1 GntR family transcriptional regulator [Paenibacillus sp. B01]
MQLKYQSLKDHVYEYIAQRIQDGSLQPGSKINEAEICKRLDISRTPTREALFQLSSDNLLDYLPRRGFTVKAFDRKKKEDYSLLLGTLDALAASLACERLEERDWKQLDRIVEAIEDDLDAHDFGGYYARQAEFHDFYQNRCGNSPLVDSLHSLKNGFMRQSYASDDKGRLASLLRQVNAEHRLIAQLFRERDKLRLEQAIKHHWRIIDFDMI